MRKFVIFLCFTTLLWLLNGAIADELSVLPSQVPQTFRSLSDLGLLEQGKDLTNEQKTEILLKWYRQELEHPSPTVKGLGGGDITSGYIQVQFIRAFLSEGDLRTLLKVRSDPKTRIEIRQGIGIALLVMGDKSQGKTVANILQNNRDPFYREIAATALSYTGDTKYIPILKRALNDPYSSYGSSDVGPPKQLPVYPVREAAGRSILLLQYRDFLRDAKERTKLFNSRSEAIRSGKNKGIGDSAAPINLPLDGDVIQILIPMDNKADKQGGHMVLKYGIDRLGHAYNERDVHNWAVQASHRETLSTDGLKKLIEIVHSLPTSNKQVDKDKSVVLVEHTPLGDITRTYDRSTLPWQMEDVFNMLGGIRFEVEAQVKFLPKGT